MVLNFTPRFFFILACFSLAGFFSSSGQTLPVPATTNTPSTNAPAAAAPAPIALADVVAQAQAAEARLQDLQSGLDPDQALQDVDEELPKITAKIDQQNSEASQQSEGATTLSSLQSSLVYWQSLSDRLLYEQKSLTDRVRQLDQFLWELSLMDGNWKATLDSAQKAKAPPEIINLINEVRTGIAVATRAVKDHQTPLYTMQGRVASQDARTQSGLDGVNRRIDMARQQLLEQNRPALWDSAAFANPTGGVVIQERASLNAQAREVAIYLKTKIGAVVVHALIFILLIFAFIWLRNSVKARAEKEPALTDATHVFDVPVANAFLIGLIAAVWLYPNQPRLLWAAFGATALIPAIIVIRRLIDVSRFPLLYATIVAYLVDELRYVVTPSGLVARFLFIFELMAACIFLLAALRFKHLSDAEGSQSRLKRLTRVYLHLAFFALVFAGLANVFGYIQLSILVGTGTLESSYLAVILYAAVRIVDAMAISAMSIWPLSSLGMVRRHHDLLAANVTIGIRWAFYGIWFVTSLWLFSQLDLVWQTTNALLWQDKYKWFNIEFTLGAVLAFPVTVWASFLISRFLRFVLEEEVYPHMSLSRGIPYAASTMIHYSILVIGFFAAVAATGTELSQFAFLAGAFGVGLGFGLQNIMNNFVSGVILLFERPIKVGDVVQIDPATVGKVERIGIRASVILLANGAEVIVPNGNLISNPVTNWTLSNCERQIEIPVTVTSKVDPAHVISILTKVASQHPDVIKNPGPRAYLVTFAGATLTFRLSAWIDSADEWMKISSDLSVAVNSELAKENIALG